MADKKESTELKEEILEINRISRTVKGGRRLRFRVLLAMGDFNGRIGIGMAKGREVSEAIKKATVKARRHLITVSLTPEKSLAQPISINSGSAQIILRPIKGGSDSIKAGSVIRTILHLAGIKAVSAKILGSNNKVNNARVLIEALAKLKSEESKN
ncbi:MAG: small subunit ribosomal protein S5 [Candidatus Berkelbacteria bacterium Licking1014_2]|uniref:Small ribosomal subunit protein uS5 n=1 Tax=Candidatus Berkelbacteria bacterium Licking1014_2 TaxID=2017146 RepID=A0A554LWX8_9BACT|nr:MAG: small subunit ribosomal protein S5 [Candidatus Berkelbacteria bacterium Licking1014_2]